MDRFKQLDATNSSIGTLLDDDEEVISIQASVGLYDGKDKALHHTAGTIYLTSHRLIYVDDALPHRYSCHLQLALIKATEHYTGFFKSSPKVTLFLADALADASTSASSNGPLESMSSSSPLLLPDQHLTAAGASSLHQIGEAARQKSATPSSRKLGDWRASVQAFDTGSDQSQLQPPWICRICGFSNRSSSGGRAETCQLCGVASGLNNSPSQPAPLTSAATHHATVSASPAPAARSAGDTGVPCPVCTFVNHPSMVVCELCEAALGTHFPLTQPQQKQKQRTNDSATAASSSSTSPSPSPSPKPSPSTNPTERHAEGSLPARSPAPATPQYPWSVTLPLRAEGSSGRSPAGVSAPLRIATAADHVRLSFRKGGDKEWYEHIKSTLKAKAWVASTSSSFLSGSAASNIAINGEVPRTSAATTSTTWRANGRSAAATATTDIDGRAAAMRKAGIEGILRAADDTAREQHAGMADALKDLEALMHKAKQMVRLAETLNEKLVRQEAQQQQQSKGEEISVEGQVVTQSSEAATLIRSSLVRLGLPAPAVTEDMAKDEMEYHMELARELAGLLLGTSSEGGSSTNGAARSGPKATTGLMGSGTVLRKGTASAPTSTISTCASATKHQQQHQRQQGLGLVNLDEVWCLWNRARGVALVSPLVLRTVTRFLPQITSPPIALRTFRSGLCVLHTPYYSLEAFEARLLCALKADTVPRDEAEPRDADSLPWGTGRTSVEIARMEDVPILLATEMIELVEATTGTVARDDGAKEGTRWYPNFISPGSAIAG
ncbi:hypothetical protein K437DRAFT_254522 [Tilletiaria anomala UBC 951]|uniref:Vacuolar protein-sorting-associated protein 36 n=1 Tax=Tilletiaria anomala (strain ATCC 24038 / CBS 436.72 / UBC 951) TaxID=1037660 RepID=A0A066WDW5_TILAU|nr:uncharacterized protein K437DRAFT_254522 [Tilletiaria anomala UBC 951]KDN52147.1 hypothetical protein K437DRAFT_254522 [Tilletiaria anomala UBC 951]